MKNLNKTAIFTIALSFASIITAFIVQIRAQSKVGVLCSYFDPVVIDILAFS